MYAELPRDVEEAIEATDKFMKCLLGLYANKGVLGTARDFVDFFSRMKRKGYNWTLGWYRVTEHPSTSRSTPSGLNLLSTRPSTFLQTVLPDWPPPITDAQRCLIMIQQSRVPLTVEEEAQVETLRERVQAIIDNTAPARRHGSVAT